MDGLKSHLDLGQFQGFKNDKQFFLHSLSMCFHFHVEMGWGSVTPYLFDYYIGKIVNSSIFSTPALKAYFSEE